MSKKHTAAPWHGRVQNSGQGLVFGADGQNVAVVFDGEADTALVAAAPELLAALREMTEWANACGAIAENCGALDRTISLDVAIDAARAAIRKAEGDA